MINTRIKDVFNLKYMSDTLQTHYLKTKLAVINCLLDFISLIINVTRYNKWLKIVKRFQPDPVNNSILNKLKINNWLKRINVSRNPDDISNI